MTIGLQILLATIAILTAVMIILNIRKSRIQIEDSFFWLVLRLYCYLCLFSPTCLFTFPMSWALHRRPTSLFYSLFFTDCQSVPFNQKAILG